MEVKLPSFWVQDVLLWFIHAESVSHKNRIATQSTVYHDVLTALHPTVIAQVRSIVPCPPAKNPYNELKRVLLSCATASTPKRLAELQTPSQLMRHTLFLH